MTSTSIEGAWRVALVGVELQDEICELDNESN